MTHTDREQIYLAIIAALLLVPGDGLQVHRRRIDDHRRGRTHGGHPGAGRARPDPARDARFSRGLQRIDEALSRGDMQGVAKASRALGTPKTHDAPVAILGKLPLRFKTLAFGVHRDFDAIAADAERGGRPSAPWPSFPMSCANASRATRATGSPMHRPGNHGSNPSRRSCWRRRPWPRLGHGLKLPALGSPRGDSRVR